MYSAENILSMFRINLYGDMVTYPGDHFIMHKNIKSLY